MRRIFTLLFLLLLLGTFAAAQTTDNAFLNLDEKPWQTCGNCGNSSSTGPTATYSVVLQNAVSRDGIAAQFNIKGVAGSYANAYWYQKRSGKNYNPAWAAFTKFTYAFDILIPAGATPQALEWEHQTVISGYLFNTGTQCEWKDKVWRIFNKLDRAWVSTGIPCTLTADGQWHHIELRTHFDLAGNQTAFDSISVDNKVNQVGELMPAVYVGATASNYISNAFQLDDPNTGVAYSVYLDKVMLVVGE